MRWLKHMTASHDDEKISDLIARFGHAGYGTWWLVLEIVAGRLEPGGEPSVTYHVNKWANLMSLRGSHVRQYLEKLVVTHLVTVEWNGDDVTVTIPNLLKYRDEWTSRSGVAREKLPHKIQIQSIDTDKEPPNPHAPQNGACLNGVPSVKAVLPVLRKSRNGKRTTEEIKKALGPERLVWWENFWEVFPCHDGMNEGMGAFEHRVKDHDLAVIVWKAAKSYRAKCDADPTIKVKFAQGWINSERWLDEGANANGKPAAPPPTTIKPRKEWIGYDPETLLDL